METSNESLRRHNSAIFTYYSGGDVRGALASMIRATLADKLASILAPIGPGKSLEWAEATAGGQKLRILEFMYQDKPYALGLRIGEEPLLILFSGNANDKKTVCADVPAGLETSASAEMYAELWLYGMLAGMPERFPSLG